MKKDSRRLPILDVNPVGDTAARLYPIQPYRIDEGDYVSFPSSRFKDIVAFYYQMRIDESKTRTIYPAGNTAVVCRLDNDRPKLCLVGTPTVPRKAEYVVSNGDYFAALFWLGMGYCIFPNPPSEIIDAHIPLDEIFPEASERFTEEMALAESFHRRVQLFERFLSEIMIDTRQIPRQHTQLLENLCRTSDTFWDEDFKKSRHPEFSNRHIRRLCIKYLGLSPKLFRRIFRYQKTLRFLNAYPEDCMAGLALDQGYFDQSHFIKEFRRFQGETPTEFIRKFSTQ